MSVCELCNFQKEDSSGTAALGALGRGLRASETLFPSPRSEQGAQGSARARGDRSPLRRAACGRGSPGSHPPGTHRAAQGPGTGTGAGGDTARTSPVFLRNLLRAPNRRSHSPSWGPVPGSGRDAARTLRSRLHPGGRAGRRRRRGRRAPGRRDAGRLRASAAARVRPGQATLQAAAVRPMPGGRGAGAAGRALPRRRGAPRARPGPARTPGLSAPGPAASRPGSRSVRPSELQGLPPPPPPPARLFIFPERRRRGGRTAGRRRGRGRGRERRRAATPRAAAGAGERGLERARWAPPPLLPRALLPLPSSPPAFFSACSLLRFLNLLPGLKCPLSPAPGAAHPLLTAPRELSPATGS